MRTTSFLNWFGTNRNKVVCLLSGLVALIALAGCATKLEGPLVFKCGRFERELTSVIPYNNPVQSVTLTATFTSPLGEKFKVYGFWDGGLTWRVRFSPNQAGTWTYRTECSERADYGLNQIEGRFICTAPSGLTRFTQHGHVKVSNNHRYLTHDDLTPFFWLADTAWNGPLRSTDKEWPAYLATRVSQNFSAIQFVGTQWRAAPDGDINNQKAYAGQETIYINPAFFQRLDRKVDEIGQAGLLAAPVLLWAIQSGSNPNVNPGVSLPEDQAIILARYMVARWGANPVLWILAGDGDYRGEKSEKWKRIGRAVFGDIYHAPVSLHPGGRMWVMNDFQNEPWLDLCGYQSAHNEQPENLKWITSGPPATDWNKSPVRPFLSLEAPYENHHGMDGKAMSADVVRRAHYWSLLNAPTVGVTYGAHGIWGWDDGSAPPVDHPRSGTPLPWPQALQMPGAAQMKLLSEFFNSIDFSRLVPAPGLLAVQPGVADATHYIAAAMTDRQDLAVVYVPADTMVQLKPAVVAGIKNSKMTWFNPRTGERHPATPTVSATACQVTTPGTGDWVLLIQANR
ncbi:MAG: DUF4038 domain-containing protein [Verrucomicrobiota bacterium]